MLRCSKNTEQKRDGSQQAEMIIKKIDDEAAGRMCISVMSKAGTQRQLQFFFFLFVSHYCGHSGICHTC